MATFGAPGMKQNLRPFSLKANIETLVAALAGFIFMQLYCRHSGIGVSPDSVTYISSARHILQGSGFIAFDDLPVVDFPAGYPLFLAGLSFLTRLDCLQYGPILNGLLYGGMIYCCGSIMNGFSQRSPWYKRVLLLAIVFGPPLLEVYSLLWSETVFIIIMLLFVWTIHRYLQNGKLKTLILAATLVSVGCLLRYAGVFLIGLGLFLIFFDRNQPWWPKVKRCILFTAIAVVLLGLNVLRNMSVRSLATGARQKSITSLTKNLEYFGGVISEWMLIERQPLLCILITLGVATVLLAGLAWCYFRNRRDMKLEYVICATGFFYIAFMIASATLSRYEQYTNRLLSPLYVPMLLGCTFWIPVFITARRSWIARGAVTVAFLGIGTLFINKELISAYENWDGIKDAGIPGYREDPFPQSEIVLFLQEFKPKFRNDFLIYSNAGDAVYFFTGLSCRLLPQPHFPKDILKYFQEPKSYLVWFNDVDNPDLLGLEATVKNKHMQLVKQLSDGAVYVTAD